MTQWREAKGHRPNTSAEKCFVRYRNGLESKHAYSINTQRWDHADNSPWDIVAYLTEREDAA